MTKDSSFAYIIQAQFFQFHVWFCVCGSEIHALFDPKQLLNILFSKTRITLLVKEH